MGIMHCGRQSNQERFFSLILLHVRHFPDRGIWNIKIQAYYKIVKSSKTTHNIPLD